MSARRHDPLGTAGGDVADALDALIGEPAGAAAPAAPRPRRGGRSTPPVEAEAGTIRRAVTLDAGDYAELQRIAAQGPGVSATALIRQAIREWLERRAGKAVAP